MIAFTQAWNFLQPESNGTNAFIVRTDGSDYSQISTPRETETQDDKIVTYHKKLPAINSDGSRVLYFIAPWYRYEDGAVSYADTGECYLEAVTIVRA